MATADNPVDVLSDEELADHIAQARLSRAGKGVAYAIDLTESYVTKTYTKDHLDDVSCAIAKARDLGIRAPAIKRIVQAGNGRVECIQERIRGPTLMDAWADLGWVSTVRLAFQLRGMVRRMRTATSPTAGSIGTGLCRSFWLEEYYGIPPRASPSVIASVVNFWHNLVSFRKEASKTLEQHRQACAGPTRPDGSLVFTHHDLAPRNIILEEGTGYLWLVDWDESGWYPRYFEHAGMRNVLPPRGWGWFGEFRWRLFCWIATGWWYGGERKMLEEIRRKATRFPAARRFNIKAGVTPSARPVDD